MEQKKSDFLLGAAAKSLKITKDELYILIKKEQEIEGLYKDGAGRYRFSPQAIEHLRKILNQEKDPKEANIQHNPNWEVLAIVVATTYAFLSALLESAFSFLSIKYSWMGYLLLALYIICTIFPAIWVWRNWPNPQNDSDTGYRDG